MNCSVTEEDVDKDMNIFGHDVPSLKGKVVRITPNVRKHEVVHISRYILDKNNLIILDSDICFTNALPF